jgi:hypothetical protein
MWACPLTPPAPAPPPIAGRSRASLLVTALAATASLAAPTPASARTQSPHHNSTAHTHHDLIRPAPAVYGSLPSRVLSLRAAANRFVRERGGVTLLTGRDAEGTLLLHMWTHEPDGMVTVETTTGDDEPVHSQITLAQFRDRLWPRSGGWTFQQLRQNGLGLPRYVSNLPGIARDFADRAHEGESGILVGRQRSGAETTYVFTRVEGGVTLAYRAPDGTEIALGLTLDEFRDRIWIQAGQ